MERDYERIISLPHHQSTARPHMPRADRAAQFAPFAALTGYDEAVRETARLTEERIELTDDEKALLDEMIRRAFQDRLLVCITYFRPDGKKAGGAYVRANGVIRYIDRIKRIIVMEDRTAVPVDEIMGISSSGDVVSHGE